MLFHAGGTSAVTIRGREERMFFDNLFSDLSDALRSHVTIHQNTPGLGRKSGLATE